MILNCESNWPKLAVVPQVIVPYWATVKNMGLLTKTGGIVNVFDCMSQGGENRRSLIFYQFSNILLAIRCVLAFVCPSISPSVSWLVSNTFVNIVGKWIFSRDEAILYEGVCPDEGAIRSKKLRRE